MSPAIGVKVESRKLSGIEKAAALLTALGQEASAQIVQHFTDEEVHQISQAIAQMQKVTAKEAEAILEEFQQMLLAQQYVLTGGLKYAQTMLLSAFGPEAGGRLLDRVRTLISNDAASFDALQKADPQQLAKLIYSEHPQTIALILSHLESSQAAALLALLPSELRSDVAMRVGHLEQISPEITMKIATIIGKKVKGLGDFVRDSHGGVRAAADMIDRLDSGMSKEILTSIEQADIKLYETIRKLMFVFEDLMTLDLDNLKEIVQKIDRKVLTIALKGTSEELKNRIMGVMSQRSAEMLREDIEVLGAVKIREVEGAQTQIIQLVREMEKDGSLNLQQAEYVQ